MRRGYTAWRQDAPWLNRAEAWPASLFPEAEYRYFRDAGCLVCALAVLLRDCGLERESDEAVFNPWVLNERLVECGAFSPEADLELADVGRLYPLEYLTAVPYTRGNLVRLAGHDVACLVTVPGEKAARHFTTLLEVAEDDALVYDPICGERKLSSYERVCSIRPFYINLGGDA